MVLIMNKQNTVIIRINCNCIEQLLYYLWLNITMYITYSTTIYCKQMYLYKYICCIERRNNRNKIRRYYSKNYCVLSFL